MRAETASVCWVTGNMLLITPQLGNEKEREKPTLLAAIDFHKAHLKPLENQMKNIFEVGLELSKVEKNLPTVECPSILASKLGYLGAGAVKGRGFINYMGKVCASPRIFSTAYIYLGLPTWQHGKESARQCRRQETWVRSLGWKIPWSKR